MERIKALIARFGRIIFLFFMGIILIIYVALGVLYMQQAPQQRDLADQMNKLSAILRTPLTSIDPLNAENEAIYKKLAPLSDAEAIAMLVNLAKTSGIDVTEGVRKFQIPIPSRSTVSVGSGSYQLLSFKGIFVQGAPDKIASFISTLDSGARLENMVLTVLIIEDVEVPLAGVEAEQFAEKESVQKAVREMMADNGIVLLRHPVSRVFGRATNYMGDDPGTLGIFEGFPDNTTTAAEKGYTGNATPKDGYLLTMHDKINSANTTLYSTTNYTQTLKTQWYYTIEDDGTVQQWTGSSLAVATEFSYSGPSKPETRVTVDVAIYFKRR